MPRKRRRVILKKITAGRRDATDAKPHSEASRASQQTNRENMILDNLKNVSREWISRKGPVHLPCK